MRQHSRLLMLSVRRGDGRGSLSLPGAFPPHQSPPWLVWFPFFLEKSLFFFFCFNAVGFLVRSLLNECTDCFWRALNLHAFLMFTRKRIFSLFLSFLLFSPFSSSLIPFFFPYQKKKSNDLIHIKWNCWFVVTVL